MQTDHEFEINGDAPGIQGVLQKNAALVAQVSSQNVALESQAADLRKKNEELERLTEELRKNNEQLEAQTVRIQELTDQLFRVHLQKVAEDGSRRIQRRFGPRPVS